MIYGGTVIHAGRDRGSDGAGEAAEAESGAAGGPGIPAARDRSGGRLPSGPRPMAIVRLALVGAWIGAAALLVSGCGGGSGGASGFISGITLNPGPLVSAGTSVTVTATVKDATMLKAAKWTADGGTLAVATGLTTTWIAPSDLKVATDFNLTLLATETNGLSDLQTVKIHVTPTSSALSGARITGLTTSAATATPGAILTATVTVADTTQVVSVQWSADIGTLITQQGFSVQWRAPDTVAMNEVATLSVVTTGTLGDINPASIRVQVVSGTAAGVGPQITKVSATPPNLAPGAATTLAVEVANTATVASYVWSASGGTLSSTMGPSVMWIAPDTNSTASTNFQITVTVTDTLGNSTSQSVQVVVSPSRSG